MAEDGEDQRANSVRARQQFTMERERTRAAKLSGWKSERRPLSVTPGGKRDLLQRSVDSLRRRRKRRRRAICTYVSAAKNQKSGETGCGGKSGRRGAQDLKINTPPETPVSSKISSGSIVSEAGRHK